MAFRFCFAILALASSILAMTAEGMWAGTIFAPNADLILGQSNKSLYGRFLGKNVTVHQYAQVYSIPFAPEMNTAIARRK